MSTRLMYGSWSGRAIGGFQQKRRRKSLIIGLVVAIALALVISLVTVSLSPNVAQAALTLTLLDDPHLLVDSNNPASGPHVTMAYAKITNTGSTTAYDVYAYVGNGTTPGTFDAGSDGNRLAMLSAPSYGTRYIGNLAPGESRTVFWMLTYPLTHGQTYPMTIWANGAGGLLAQSSHTYTTQSTISSQANKILGSVTVNPPSGIISVGNILTVTQTGFNLGTIGTGGDTLFQPVGNIDFSPACFRLVRTEIYIHSIANNCGYGSMPYIDQLYFPGIKSCYDYDPTDYAKYYFVALQEGTTTAKVYQEAASGNTEKYSADYGEAAATLTTTAVGGSVTLAKSVSPLSGGANTLFTWTITYTNNTDYPLGDPQSGNGLVLIDEAVPTYTTYVAGSATSTATSIIHYSVDNGATWTLTEPPASQVTKIKWYINQTVPAHSSGTVSFQSRVNSGVSGTPLICNSASGRIDDGPSLAADGVCANGGVDLDLSKVVNESTPCENSNIIYTITVNNPSSGGATNVQVTDSLPSGLTYLSSGPSQGSYSNVTGLWTVGTLAAGTSATMSITATVNSGTGGHVITNTGSITHADQTDPVSSNNSAHADIAVLTRPVATASSNSPVCVENTIQLFGGPAGMASYSWTGPIAFASNLQNPTRANATLGMSGTYTLMVSAADGCTSSTTTDVVVGTVCESPPDQPSNLSPGNATCVSLPVTLRSSAFSDPNTGDTHAASQWQIRSSTGSYGSPVFDSERDTVNRTSITVPPGVLSSATTYYWHVRHQDEEGAWSIYSAETRFCAESTPAGMHVSYTEGSVTVEFTEVLVGGCTLVSTSNTNPAGPLPAGWCPLLPYTEISTTAAYSGTITVAMGYNDAGLADESLVTMLHWNGSQWVDVTSAVDTSGNVVYGNVNSLSPFIICYPCGATGGAGCCVPVFPNIYVGIGAALGAFILAYFISRRLVSARD